VSGYFGDVAALARKDLLLELRNDLTQQKKTPITEQLAMKVWAMGITHPWMYKLGQKFMPWLLKPLSRDGWVKFLPGPSGGWTKVKDLPLPARHSFLSSLNNNQHSRRGTDHE
jgi:L-lactate utilization protein LutB